MCLSRLKRRVEGKKELMKLRKFEWVEATRSSIVLRHICMK